MKQVKVIIPARYNSTRFVGKPLVDINGKPMIIRVVEIACETLGKENVFVATDDERISDVIEDYGYQYIMTTDCPTGTDRVAQASRLLDADIIVNVQGDEPLLDPRTIDGLVRLFDDPSVSMATVVSRDIGVKDYLDRNIVKVFLDENQNAYDFKRDIYDSEIGGVFRHIGFYGFQKETLFEFSSLTPSHNEVEYSLEQFRALDNNIKIKALITNSEQLAVDVPEDINRVVSKMKKLNKILTEE